MPLAQTCGCAESRSQKLLGSLRSIEVADSAPKTIANDAKHDPSRRSGCGEKSRSRVYLDVARQPLLSQGRELHHWIQLENPFQIHILHP
jgi:hypothetical protein